MENLFDSVQEFVSESSINCSVKADEPLFNKTTFKIGGKAKVFAEPEDCNSLKMLLKFCVEKDMKFFVLGGGSNIVFTDGIFDGVVVSMLRLNSIFMEKSDKDGKVKVLCGAGCTMAQLVNFCTEKGLSGVQQFAGLPGTVGGAVFMNARCFDREISDVFDSAEYLDLDDFQVKTVSYSEKDWAYKVSPFQPSGKIVFSVGVIVMESSQEEKESLVLENKKYINERKSKGHFDYPSAGSVFRNNRDFGKPSGAIIDECALKGLRIGNAQVAPFHGNFIINLGGALQEDVKKLVEKVKEVVHSKTGFNLECEIIFVD